MLFSSELGMHSWKITAVRYLKPSPGRCDSVQWLILSLYWELMDGATNRTQNLCSIFSQYFLSLGCLPSTSTLAKREWESQRNPSALVVFKQPVLASSPNIFCSYICNFKAAEHRGFSPSLSPSLPASLPSCVLVQSPPVAGWGLGKVGRKEN